MAAMPEKGVRSHDHARVLWSGLLDAKSPPLEHAVPDLAERRQRGPWRQPSRPYEPERRGEEHVVLLLSCQTREREDIGLQEIEGVDGCEEW